MDSLKTIPIKEISTFCTKWKVQGTVVNAEKPKEFQSKSGGRANKVWNISIVDDQGDEIQCVFWGEAVDVFKSKIEEGKTYAFSRGSVKVSNKKFTTCPHPYQLTFTPDSVIVEVEAPNAKPGKVTRKFNTEGGLRNLKTSMKERTDCLGLVLSFRAQASITTKNGNSRVLREFWVCDSTGHKIKVDLWADNDEELKTIKDSDLMDHPIVGIRNCRVSDFRGKGLLAQAENVEFYPQCEIDESNDQMYEQLKWYNNNLSRLDSLVSLTEEYQGTPGSGTQKTNVINLESHSTSLKKAHNTLVDTFMTKQLESSDVLFNQVVYPTRMFYSNRDDPENRLTCFYQACSSCGRKWSNEIGCACSNNSKQESRYILQCSISDHSASKMYCRFFGKQGEALMSICATEIEEKSKRGDDVSRYFDWDALHRPISVKFKCNLTEYGGEKRLNITALGAEPIRGHRFIDEAVTLLEQLAVEVPEMRSSTKRARETDVDMEANSNKKQQIIA